jgi:hypothetical protein
MKSFRIALAFVVVVGFVPAQNWVEAQAYGQTARVDGLFSGQFNKSFGSFAWMQQQKGYGQAYAGITYSPKTFVQLALGAGLEQDARPARVGSYVWLGKGKSSVLGVFEDGGSGFFYKVEANYQAVSRFGVGILSDRFRGHGPKAEFLVPHTPVKVWLASLWKDGSVSPLLGIRWSFK